MPPTSNPVPLVAATGFWKGLHPAMGITSKGMITLFVAFTVFDVEFAELWYTEIRSWIELNLNWYYIGIFAVLMFVCLYLSFSRHGSVKLGDDDSRPEFSTFAWFAMLFSAGIGIGLLFFGIAEPIFYFDNSSPRGYPNNPFADRAHLTELNEARAASAVRVACFHWGLHGWAIYVIVGLCLAYFGFRKKLPLTLRSSLYPIIGDRIYGPIGHLVDLLALFGTVFGIATSLGFGVIQMAQGLHFLFEIDPGLRTQIWLIVTISFVATFSAMTGVGKGIRIISEWNIWLSLLLLAYFLFGGDFQWLLKLFGTTVAGYLKDFIPMGFQIFSETGEASWQGAWTIFYWGWWISWAPFVGIFIARISRGRTIREFILGVMFVPTVVTFFWFCVFGGNAIHQELTAENGVGTAGIIQSVKDHNLPAVLYGTIDQMTGIPGLNWAMAALATFLLATWFITSSDSGTLVITTMLSMGHDDPPQRFRVFWGLGIGCVAAALLLAEGLSALQSATIATALPVSVIVLLMTFGIMKSLHQDPGTGSRPAKTFSDP